MKYNFDEVIQRRNTKSIKWDRSDDENVLPMWIADMDFKAALPIQDALNNRVNNGVFGYTLCTEDYYNAITHWWERRYNFKIEKDWIVHCTGVVPALSYLIRTFTEPGDKVLIQPPVYNAFNRVIKNNGCEIASNELVFNGEKYEIDFDDFEKKASDPKVKLLLLCSPHNPVGRVWSREELIRIGEICLKYNVLVIIDEIHCDLVYEGYKFIPFASISGEFLNNSITCTSPGKTFNLAGIKISNMIIGNNELKSKVKHTLRINEIGEASIFGAEALISAYNYGEEWLLQLIEYLKDNFLYLDNFIRDKLPQLKVIVPEATYLIWVDCNSIGISSNELSEKLLKEGKVWCTDGAVYGKNGEGFLRINIACPRELLIEGLNRIRRTIDSIK